MSDVSPSDLTDLLRTVRSASDGVMGPLREHAVQLEGLNLREGDDGYESMLAFQTHPLGQRIMDFSRSLVPAESCMTRFWMDGRLHAERGDHTYHGDKRCFDVGLRFSFSGTGDGLASYLCYKSKADANDKVTFLTGHGELLLYSPEVHGEYEGNPVVHGRVQAEDLAALPALSSPALAAFEDASTCPVLCGPLQQYGLLPAESKPCLNFFVEFKLPAEADRREIFHHVKTRLLTAEKTEPTTAVLSSADAIKIFQPLLEPQRSWSLPSYWTKNDSEIGGG